VDTAIERSRGGLGIGLTLVQKITGMHSGRVEVESAGPGTGCTFRVRLPCPPGATAPLPEAQAAADTNAIGAGDGPAATEAGVARVLVVDDNRDAADTLAMMVRMLGHDVAQVYDPALVEAEVERFTPDLVFLDVGMPGRSGHEIARSLRAASDRASHALDIVAVTGWGQPEDRDRTRDAGFDEHLTKPPQLDAIRRLCAAAGRRRGTP